MDNLEQVKKFAARASVEPHALPELLYSVRTAIGGVMTTVESYCARSSQIEMLSTDRPDILVETRHAFEVHYSKINPRVGFVLDSAVGTILNDDILGDDRQLMHHEFYADFLAPSDLRYFCATKLIDNARCRTLISVQRSPGQDRFSEDDKFKMAKIVPHLANCLALNLSMRDNASSANLSESFGQLGEPVAVICPDGKLQFTNDAMQAVFREGKLFGCKNQRIYPIVDLAANALGQVIHDIAIGAGSALAPIAPLDDSCGAVLRAVQLDPEHANEFSSGIHQQPILLLIDDPSRPVPKNAEKVIDIFGLTRREADVGLLFASGLSVNDIAALLGLSRNTVRSHASMLRQKCDVNTSLGVAARIRSACA